MENEENLSKKKKSNRVLWISIIFVILLTLGIAAGYYFGKNNNEVVSNNEKTEENSKSNDEWNIAIPDDFKGDLKKISENRLEWPTESCSKDLFVGLCVLDKENFNDLSDYDGISSVNVKKSNNSLEISLLNKEKDSSNIKTVNNIKEAYYVYTESDLENDAIIVLTQDGKITNFKFTTNGDINVNEYNSNFKFTAVALETYSMTQGINYEVVGQTKDNKYVWLDSQKVYESIPVYHGDNYSVLANGDVYINNKKQDYKYQFGIWNCENNVCVVDGDEYLKYIVTSDGYLYDFKSNKLYNNTRIAKIEKSKEYKNDLGDSRTDIIVTFEDGKVLQSAWLDWMF